MTRENLYSHESRRAVREHNQWTRQRLRDHAVDCLGGGKLVVVSNREPYMHQLAGAPVEDR